MMKSGMPKPPKNIPPEIVHYYPWVSHNEGIHEKKATVTSEITK